MVCTRILSEAELSTIAPDNSEYPITLDIPLVLDQIKLSDHKPLEHYGLHLRGQTTSLKFEQVKAYERAPGGASYTPDRSLKNHPAGSPGPFEVHHLEYSKTDTEGGPFGNGGWAGMYFAFKKNDSEVVALNPNASLSFWIRVPESEGGQVRIAAADKNARLIGTSTLAPGKIESYIVGADEKTKLTKQWQEMRVPLSVFKDTDSSQMSSFVLQATAGKGIIEVTTPVLRH